MPSSVGARGGVVSHAQIKRASAQQQRAHAASAARGEPSGCRITVALRLARFDPVHLMVSDYTAGRRSRKPGPTRSPEDVVAFGQIPGFIKQSGLWPTACTRLGLLQSPLTPCGIRPSAFGSSGVEPLGGLWDSTNPAKASSPDHASNLAIALHSARSVAARRGSWYTALLCLGNLAN